MGRDVLRGRLFCVKLDDASLDCSNVKKIGSEVGDIVLRWKSFLPNYVSQFIPNDGTRCAVSLCFYEYGRHRSTMPMDHLFNIKLDHSYCMSSEEVARFDKYSNLTFGSIRAKGFTPSMKTQCLHLR
jgi:hypothetical protein